jgi:branched-chain amino acid aminotransferase
VSEGSGEDIFVIRGGIIVTPPAASSILPGITRDTIITLAKEHGYEVRHDRIPREALYIADEIFFTGAAAEVTPVRSVDRIQVGGGKRGRSPRCCRRRSSIRGEAGGSVWVVDGDSVAAGAS